jgi:hypothetical protein
VFLLGELASLHYSIDITFVNIYAVSFRHNHFYFSVVLGA